MDIPGIISGAVFSVLLAAVWLFSTRLARRSERKKFQLIVWGGMLIRLIIVASGILIAWKILGKNVIWFVCGFLGMSVVVIGAEISLAWRGFFSENARH